MKKISFAVLLVATAISCALAAESVSEAASSILSPAQTPSESTGAALAPDGFGAPGPSAANGAAQLQVFGSLVGASVLSLMTYYFQ